MQGKAAKLQSVCVYKLVYSQLETKLCVCVCDRPGTGGFVLGIFLAFEGGRAVTSRVSLFLLYNGGKQVQHPSLGERKDALNFTERSRLR